MHGYRYKNDPILIGPSCKTGCRGFQLRIGCVIRNSKSRKKIPIRGAMTITMRIVEFQHANG
jgi:hypothetical protein